MRRHEFPLEEIMAELQANEAHSQQHDWMPGFEGDRQVVVSRLGPFFRCYRKPKRFIKRFCHTLYSLPVADWQISINQSLFGDLCSFKATLNLRFQASYQYALANSDNLANINEHIKTNFEGLIRDILEKELRNLEEGEWIKNGLSEAKQKIETGINETLIIQNIQSRAICELEPTFAQISDDAEFDSRFIRKSVYMEVLRQNFSFREQQKQEWFRQQELLAEQQLAHQQKQLHLLEKEGDLLCIRQAKEAENQKRLLVEADVFKVDELATERQVYARNINHQGLLKAMDYEAEVKEREKKQAIDHQAELMLQESSIQHDKMMNDKRIEHERQLKEQALEFEIEEFETRQTRWNSAEFEQQTDKIKQDRIIKEQELEAEIIEQEIRIIAQQKLEERVKEEKITHEGRLRTMELEAEQENQLARYKATQNSHEFLSREIDLLTLEKQKVELSKQIKFAEEMLEVDK